MSVGRVHAYLLKEKSDPDSQVQHARQEKGTNGKLGHLANALNLLFARVAASSYATAKALKVR